MNGQNHPSLPTKSQMESHCNSTCPSAPQNGCETSPRGQADQLRRQENALKISATETIPRTRQPRTSTSVHAISNSSWRTAETIIQHCSSVVHFFIIGQHSDKDFELNTHTHKLSPLYKLTKQESFHPFRICSESYHILTHTIHMQLYFSCLLKGTATTKLR